MPRLIAEYPTLDTTELVAELAQVIGQLKRSTEQLANARSEYDRIRITAYFDSNGRSVAERDRDAELASMRAHDDYLDFECQVKTHTTVRDFLVQLIEWRHYGVEGAPWLQRREQADPEEGRRLKGVG
jgi:hypothetical protein